MKLRMLRGSSPEITSDMIGTPMSSNTSPSPTPRTRRYSLAPVLSVTSAASAPPSVSRNPICVAAIAAADCQFTPAFRVE